jgi:hypothetical protein
MGVGGQRHTTAASPLGKRPGTHCTKLEKLLKLISSKNFAEPFGCAVHSLRIADLKCRFYEISACNDFYITCLNDLSTTVCEPWHSNF